MSINKNETLKNKVFHVFKSTFVGFSIPSFLFVGLLAMTYLFKGTVGIFGENYETAIFEGYTITQGDVDALLATLEMIEQLLTSSLFFGCIGMALGFYTLNNSKSKAN
jgi:hypothetical protein